MGKTEILILAAFSLLHLVYGFEFKSSRVCTNSETYAFTGYKVENQINLRTWSNEYHLVYCNDNKLIYDKNLSDSIPWTKPIQFENPKLSSQNNSVILARRKTFASREIPIYLPTTHVGAIYSKAGKSLGKVPLSVEAVTPLLAENMLNNWLEFTFHLQLILHVPILSTPGMDSRRKPHAFEDNKWSKYISASENYTYSYESRTIFREGLDRALAKLNRVYHKVKDTEREPKTSNSSVFKKIIFLSKMLPLDQFTSVLKTLDKMKSRE